MFFADGASGVFETISLDYCSKWLSRRTLRSSVQHDPHSLQRLRLIVSKTLGLLDLVCIACTCVPLFMRHSVQCSLIPHFSLKAYMYFCIFYQKNVKHMSIHPILQALFLVDML